MGAADLALLVNLFPVEFSQTTVALPRRIFADREAVTDYLKTLPKGLTALRGVANSDGIPVYLLGAPSLDRPLPPAEQVDLSCKPDLAKKLIDKAVQAFYAQRGFLVAKEIQGAAILHPNPVLERGDVVIRRGIAIRARRPFASDPTFFVLASTWQTKAEFKQSLSNDVLRSMAVGHNVIYKPPKSVPIDKELRKAVNRRLGAVVQINEPHEAVVQCLDHCTRAIPASHLYLEANPEILTEYDRRIGNRTNSLWIELLKANFTLTSNGRRNTRVLRDRLTAVQRFLSGSGDTTLEIPVPFCDKLVIYVDLRPLTAAYG